jgi:hypothetical protein
MAKGIPVNTEAVAASVRGRNAAPLYAGITTATSGNVSVIAGEFLALSLRYVDP